MRCCFRIAVASCALALSLVPALSRAQAPQISLPSGELSSVLEQGARLESERRWSDALTYYEEAAKNHPERAELQERLLTARAHYDVDRRYSDASYTTALQTLTARQSVDTYDEILQKIFTHHFKQPEWDRMFQRGVLFLQAGLDDPHFLTKNARNATPEQIAAFRQELPRLAATFRVTDRLSARDAAAAVAKAAADRLGVPSTATLMEFACASAASLDEYSGFLTGSQVDEVFSQIEGNFVGLGVELKADNGTLLIVNTIAGGPADQGGLKGGDRITAVNGKTCQEVTTDVAADMLRGEEGSTVNVTIVSAVGSTRTYKLTRRRVEVPSVEDVKIIDRAGGVGYFKLTSFQKTTNRDVDAALWKLHAEGMRSLVIDLRGNPGGLLRAAVDVADKFVNEGLIVATRGRSPREDFDHRGQTPGTWRVPLVVLIDKDSASASEILAGAIRDHKRGQLIGEKSYGKGSVQGIFPLTGSNAGIRLTTAQWYTPSGQAISGQGIVPDTVVRKAGKPVVETGRTPAEGQDTILQAGIDAARTVTAKRPTTVSSAMLKN